MTSALVGGGRGIAGRMASRFLLELGVGLWDFQRWCRRIRSTRFEWRFLYMRLFVSVVMRDISTQAAIVDILRGVPASTSTTSATTSTRTVAAPTPSWRSTT